jgi:hypothetical protein
MAYLKSDDVARRGNYVHPSLGDFATPSLVVGALALFAGWLYLIRPGKVRVVHR